MRPGGADLPTRGCARYFPTGHSTPAGFDGEPLTPPPPPRRDFVALRLRALEKLAAETGVSVRDVTLYQLAQRIGVPRSRLTASDPRPGDWRALYTFLGEPAPAGKQTAIERAIADLRERPNIRASVRARELGVSPSLVTLAARRAGLPTLRERVRADIAEYPDGSIAERMRRLGCSRVAVLRAIAEKSAGKVAD